LDCLHNCFPGAVDMFAQLLYQDLYLNRGKEIDA
jgi:hypothetical protein